MIKIIPRVFKKIWGEEIWLNSTVPGSETHLESGEISTNGPLIKIIRTSQPLSIQVHPDDDLAREIEGQANGKSENWYILDCEPGASLVAGIKTINEEEILELLKKGDLESVLVNVLVKKEQIFNVQAGLVHGIGAGITLLEVQQPSDVTYRLYDYNRIDDSGLPRELHIEKSLRCIKDLNYELIPAKTHPLTYIFPYATEVFSKTPIKLSCNCIVIDLTTYSAFHAKEGEVISFPWFALISS